MRRLGGQGSRQFQGGSRREQVREGLSEEIGRLRQLPHLEEADGTGEKNQVSD